MKNPNFSLSRLILLMLIIILNQSVNGQSHSFLKIISDPQDQTVNSAIELPEGGYIVITGKDTAWKSAVKLIKLNSEGETIKEELMDEPDEIAWIELVLKASGNTYWGIGALCSSDYTNNQFWLIQFDEELNILKEKKYPAPYLIYRTNGTFDHFNNIIINGWYYDTGNNNSSDIFILRCSSDGDSLSSRLFTYPSVQHTNAIVEKPDYSGYYMPIWGRMTSSNYYLSNMVELDYDFNITFEDSITNDVGYNNNIRMFNDNQYLLSGQTPIPFISYDNEFIAIEKLDKEYHAANYQRVGPYQVDTTTYPAWFQNLDFIDTTSIFCGGTVNISIYPPNSASRSYLILANLDNELEKKWQYFYGLDKYYELIGILATNDGGCLLLATYYKFTGENYQRDILLIKVDSNGLVTGMTSPSGIRPLNAIVFPNPGHEYLVIQSGPQITGAQFTLYDIQGKPVKEQKISNTQLRINTSNLPSGAYPWQIVFKNKLIETGKWVKE